jgi:CRP/FNR family transcriptional regulator, cyclic AMP receptor protein
MAAQLSLPYELLSASAILRLSGAKRACPMWLEYRPIFPVFLLKLIFGGVLNRLELIPPTDMFDPKDFLEKVGDGKAILEFHKNQKVFEQGDVAETVFYIQKGKVKLSVVSEQGKEAVVAILEPGHFFGEGCMNGHRLRISTTTAMEDCVITSITKAAMIATIHDEPKFAELFMAYLLTRNSRIEEDLIDQLFNSSERRLARTLLLLANFGKEGSPQSINPNISQETLAEMIGTTRSRVSYFMNKFRKLGLISYNGHIEVNNSLLSTVLHEKPLLKERD